MLPAADMAFLDCTHFVNRHWVSINDFISELSIDVSFISNTKFLQIVLFTHSLLFEKPVVDVGAGEDLFVDAVAGFWEDC